ncbi:MAG: carbamate kinase [Myxococcota bacterium]|jgi:carbamate kinase
MGSTASRRPTVVVLGGRAFAGPDGAVSVPLERELAAAVAARLTPLLKLAGGVVVTHGNGPQVGHQLVRVEIAGERAYPLPLDTCVATTQGELGDVLATALRDVLADTGDRRLVAAVLSHVVVDRHASAFHSPSKPVGPLLDEARARSLEKHGMKVGADPGGRGLRRLVPSPEPLEILEVDVIRTLVRVGAVVVACGGGGIPVAREGTHLQAVEAVVDKDLTAALLADALDASLFLVVTDVPTAFTDFTSPKRAPVTRVTAARLRDLLAEGHFAPGTMAPKVEACVRFVNAPGRRAVICDALSVERALRGEAGTQVVFE